VPTPDEAVVLGMYLPSTHRCTLLLRDVKAETGGGHRLVRHIYLLLHPPREQTAA